MANDPLVRVSVVQPVNFRLKKTDPFIKYPVGSAVEMPRSHALALGLQHRIVAVKNAPEEGEPVITERLPFNGAFNAKISDILLKAGFQDIDAVAKASREDLLALDGIGPAAFEDIVNALSKGGK